MSRLALIAGAGELPAELTAALETPPLVCALEGVAPAGLAVERAFRIERLAPFMRQLADEGIAGVVFAGAMQRPKLDPALFDRETAALVPRMMAMMQGGDDALLRGVIALFEEYDLPVQGLAVLAPQLLAGTGVLGARPPCDAEAADAARGLAILEALAPVDVGQGCVVCAGQCLGIEALYGTDALLTDVARNRPLRAPAQGGVFVKRAKRGQDLRVDLPTIGPDTIAAAAMAGLSGICLQAGHVVVLRRAEVLACAEAAGLALWAMP
ncbi:MAG: LpxI family protein [Pararhodobacter sp.]